MRVVVALISVPSAQQGNAGKRPLTHSDYDSWRAIQSQSLSRDGQFLAYPLSPQDGDAEVVVRRLASGPEWRHGVGTRPPVQTDTDDETGSAAPAAGPAPRVSITADAKFVVFQIRPTKAAQDQAKKDKKAPADQPKDAMGGSPSSIWKRLQ